MALSPLAMTPVAAFVLGVLLASNLWCTVLTLLALCVFTTSGNIHDSSLPQEVK